MRKRILSLLATISLASVFILGMLPLSVGAIQNGTADGDDHPYVVMCIFDVGGTPAWRTTGWLIDPVTVITAGHGTYGTDGARVSTLSYIPSGYLGYPGPGAWATEASSISTHPDYRSTPSPGLPGFDAFDIGVIILSEPIVLSEYAQLPTAGYAGALKQKSSIDLVGYGVTSQFIGGGPPAWTWDRYRNFASAQLNQSNNILSDMFLKLTANPGQDKGGTTFGDSGGPILEAGTNIVLGLNSFVTNSNCDGVTYAQRVDRQDILDWIASFLS
ncbi:trypsin-like serine protease [Dehalogenimonas alkenigignens]|uniref:trypsin-like serine protease n=1 Tax=Dehalogenimonas alkenigignens TaxID=1217799 RepID=UPI000D5740F2|nr:trypsin-like serine protease [Dehalogenimonas alkenigignens]PVV82614.1 hypothetical protein DD509_08295 [Dehalogenimonas alkenigignens]